MLTRPRDCFKYFSVSLVPVFRNPLLYCFPSGLVRESVACVSKSAMLRRFSGLILLLILGACTGTGLERQVTDAGYTSDIVVGDAFLHRVVRSEGEGESLHVYIEGDGRPWVGENRIARDPTPEQARMLPLMRQDQAPALFLGRPCYFATDDPACSPLWWTRQRYAEEVVQSMSAVLDREAAGYQGVVLIGHSGGGALAMLLAGRRTDVKAVITLAGNLDIERWATHHGYSPLQGSLNPARQPPLSVDIAQSHYLGMADEKITVDMVQPVVNRQEGAHFYLLPGIGHSCCWEEAWPQILQDWPAAQ